MKPQTYIYIESSNEVREKATMEKPYRPAYFLSAEFDYYIQLRKEYEQHLASLKQYPCSEDCRGRFKDGEEVTGELKYGGFNTYVFHPITPKETEDELWDDFANHYSYIVRKEPNITLPEVIAYFQKSFNIQRK